MACSEQCSMCIMSEEVHVQVHMQVHLQVQVQCVVYTVQCVWCRVLPGKDEDLAAETVILNFSLL